LLLFGEHQTGIHIGRFKSPLVVAVDEAMTFIKKSTETNCLLRHFICGVTLRNLEPGFFGYRLNCKIHRNSASCSNPSTDLHVAGWVIGWVMGWVMGWVIIKN